jgi:hypothetical protein
MSTVVLYDDDELQFNGGYHIMTTTTTTGLQIEPLIKPKRIIPMALGKCDYK